MFRIPLPLTDDALLLSPGIGSVSRWIQFAVILLLLIGLAWLLRRVYRRELEIVPPRVAVLLMALRVGVLAILFLLLSLEPKLSGVEELPVPSRVLLAVDLSDSMNVPDPQRSDLEKSELASVFRLSDPAFSDTLTRKQLAQKVLSEEGLALLRRIAEIHPTEVIGFQREILDLPSEPKSLMTRLQEKFGPGSDSTDLSLPRKAAGERAGNGQGKFIGIVILSDGQHNQGTSPLKLTEEGESIPLYPVLIGANDPPPDFAVASVRTPSTVFQNTDASIEARIRIQNQPAGKVRVILSFDGDAKREPLVEVIDHDPATPLRTVRFSARMEKAGSETVTVTIKPDSPTMKDTIPENNSRSATLRVAPDKARVLLIDSEARWEFRYLWTALQRDPSIETKAVLFDQPRLGTLTDDDLKKLNAPESKLPADAESWLSSDAVVLGDVSPDQLPREDRDRLEKFVAERGGTLVIQAGKRSMPSAFQLLAADDPLRKLLPLQNVRPVKSLVGFPFRLTAEGRQTPFLQLEPTPSESLETWASLQPHFWGEAGTAKPGSTVLATFSENDRPQTAEQERANALMVRQNYGFGRVVYVGIDSTWRWRFRTGDTYHHRFWGQLIRWAASDRPLITGNEFIRFGAREAIVRSDQEAEVLARFSEKAGKIRPDALIGMRLLRKGENGKEEAIGLINLKSAEDRPEERVGGVRDLPPGEYHLEMIVPELEDKLIGPDGKKLRSGFRVLPPDTGELADLSTNRELLEQMARRTGGKFFTAAKAGDLPELLKTKVATIRRPREKKLWESWWVLLSVLGLLTAEWLIRKRFGMV